MSAASTIEWTDATWNPVRGCAIVSKGCTNCYAMRQAHRFSDAGRAYAGLTQMSKGGPVWTGRARTVPELLDAPLHWRKPRRVFVNSMSDLFHEDVPDSFVLQVFDIMRQSENGFSRGLNRHVPTHTYQILTKRPARMLDFCRRLRFAQNDARGMYLAQCSDHNGFNPIPDLRHVWLGVSVEDQASADERIPLLLQTRAAVRWISAEPLLGPVDLDRALYGADYGRGQIIRHSGQNGLDWVVTGGESGPGARPSHPDWFRSLRDQCATADVPFFFKQWGAWLPSGQHSSNGWLCDLHPVATRERERRGAVHVFADGEAAIRLRKTEAGRSLDGRTHDGYPR